MPVPLEQFVKHLEDSGLLAGDTLGDFLPPKASPRDAEDLARELVRHKKLTKFQAEELYRGKGKSLTLGNYVLMEKIGAGGMGQVFKAEHRRMHRMVAIKLLPAAMTKDQAAIARFEREVTAAARLRHPNIVAADDADQANGVHFLVMELVDGSDLSALVKKNGPLPVDKAVNYVLQAAKGLEFAHAEGIVHRDIKPANLLLDKKGTVKILDMGLARIHGDGGQAELTSTGAVMGTVDYMAPEQALNTKTADARADIYALGCSLYYLLTGKATYDGDTLMAKLLAHRDLPIPDLRAACPQASDRLEAIFKTMVAKKTADRYQTMTAVIADLEGCGGGQTANPPSFAASDTGLTNFLKEIAVAPNSLDRQKSPVRTPRRSWPNLNWQSIARDKRKLLIGGGVLGALVLLAVVFGNLPKKDVKVESGGEQPIAAKPVPRDKPVVAGGKPWESPDFKKWTQRVAGMPAEKQVEAVSQKLKELNPEFDGKLSSGWVESSLPVIQDGNVVELRIFTDKIADLWPIRALSELRGLSCESKQKPGRRLDLSPLSGMKIRTLSCVVAQLDLSTVQGLPLSELACLGGGGITDLTPISGMPFHGLALSGNWDLTNLKPLKGMPLTYLWCDNSQVADLSPLSGMPLKTLICHVTQVADLTPLKDMPLEELYCHQTLITDLSPLAEMKLKKLSFTPSPGLKGLAAIRQMDSLVEIGTAHDKLISSSEFWKQYDAGAFNSADAVKPVTDVSSPEFQKWMKNVQSLRAEDQIEAVRKKLKELNPEFDGKLSWRFWDESSLPVVQDGVVVELMIIPDKVADLSPIRAFSELRLLECWSRQDTAQPLDLSALRGMKIRVLSCFGRHLDFSTVKSLPISELTCIGGRNTDLTMLAGMPLKSFAISGNWDLTNIEPLKGMPLTSFVCDNTQVADLSPLGGMPLTILVCPVTKVADLSPLKGMPLEELYCHQTLITDLSPLAGMKLKKLTFTPNPGLKGLQAIRQMDSLAEIGTAQDKMISSSEFWKKYDAGAFNSPDAVKPVTDVRSPEFQKWMKNVQSLPAEDQIEAVRKKLIELNPGFDGKLTDRWAVSPPAVTNGIVTQMTFVTDQVTDIFPVRALVGLEFLACRGSAPDRGKLRDLSPLKGMTMTHLDLSDNARLSDLSPLNGSRLTHLGCTGTHVTDLSVLRGMALEELWLGSTEVSDLAPLQGMPLKKLMLWGAKVADLSALKGMELRVLNIAGTPVENLLPLKGMPLESLVLNHTPVTDLSPLKGMPLESLNVQSSNVSDLSPLAGTNLNVLIFTPRTITKGIDVIRRMRSLKTIGTLNDEQLPADEFWKKYDAGVFGKP
jgi:serine/threonine protein kinase/Leucine-rich repeat (LRR) protein